MKCQHLLGLPLLLLLHVPLSLLLLTVVLHHQAWCVILEEVLLLLLLLLLWALQPSATAATDGGYIKECI